MSQFWRNVPAMVFIAYVQHVHVLCMCVSECTIYSVADNVFRMLSIWNMNGTGTMENMRKKIAMKVVQKQMMVRGGAGDEVLAAFFISMSTSIFIFTELYFFLIIMGCVSYFFHSIYWPLRCRWRTWEICEFIYTTYTYNIDAFLNDFLCVVLFVIVYFSLSAGRGPT